jgi:hypothetical protein
LVGASLSVWPILGLADLAMLAVVVLHGGGLLVLLVRARGSFGPR